ncbi:MAG TPA: hypothetical protein DCP91_13750, partial [Eggerthellaceae bacterium]|nr:hypothetical protein [Eggerthellaceae bacterium]
MFGNLGNRESDRSESKPKDGARRWSLSRRSLIGAAAIAGLAASARPAERAFAWSSWTNATSGMLKKIGMGDCVHEDLVQISYARVVRKYKGESTSQSLLNPWGGVIKEGDAQHATIAGDTVYAGEGKTFESADQLAKLLYRENLAYLRIGSFWNDAAANQLKDFAYSCGRSNCVPKFSGSGGDYYEGAWDVGKHIRDTHTTNQGSITTRGLDALVQFTMNDRNNFIHGMLTSQADLSRHLSQAEVKRYALQWLGVAYEFARTGDIDNLKTSDVTNEQAKQIFNGFIDTYGQLADENDTEEDKHGMCVSLQVSSSEASITLPKRRLRLRALGMMCHTLEDFWCPAHTCRTYHEGGSVPKNSILAFSNYKLQNGNKAPMFGYHIPFDRYAVSDAKNSTANWREAFTRGQGQRKGTETLDNALSDSMNDIENAHTLFNTLGMNETIECITQLFDYMYQGKAWDDGVRDWVDKEIMPTYFNGDESYICDAGRRSLHTPTYLIAPIELMKRAYRKAGMSDNYKAILKAAKDYDAWQRGAHLFHSGECNTNKSKTIPSGYESKSIWSEETGEERLLELVNELHEGYSILNSDASKKRDLLARIGCNGCHAMATALFRVGGMLQDFNIELRGELRPNGTDNRDEIMQKIFDLRAFFESGLQLGLQAQGDGEDAQSSPALGL